MVLMNSLDTSRTWTDVRWLRAATDNPRDTFGLAYGTERVSFTRAPPPPDLSAGGLGFMMSPQPSFTPPMPFAMQYALVSAFTDPTVPMDVVRGLGQSLAMSIESAGAVGLRDAAIQSRSSSFDRQLEAEARDQIGREYEALIARRPQGQRDNKLEIKILEFQEKRSEREVTRFEQLRMIVSERDFARALYVSGVGALDTKQQSRRLFQLVDGPFRHVVGLTMDLASLSDAPDGSSYSAGLLERAGIPQSRETLKKVSPEVRAELDRDPSFVADTLPRFTAAVKVDPRKEAEYQAGARR